jgi:hypothetical protein
MASPRVNLTTSIRYLRASFSDFLGTRPAHRGASCQAAPTISDPAILA